MMKIFTLLTLILLGFNTSQVVAQANPSVGILPMNPGGIVALGVTMDIKVTINNTLSGSIPAAKLRPVITIPSVATILPTAQQTGLPAGWTVVTNAAGQIRVCNSGDVIGGNEQRDIFIKVQGAIVGGPSICQVQINFGGSTCTVSGPQPSGNITVDDFATSSITVVPGCGLGISAIAGNIQCNGGNTIITVSVNNATGPVEYSLTGADPFQPGNVFSNVPAGTYNVTAREVNNPVACVVSTSLTIIDPPLVEAPSVNIIHPDCTTPNGGVTISTSTTDLSFSVDGGAYTAYPTGGYSLSPGPHSIIAKNANDCISTTTNFTINTQPSTPATPATGLITQPGCAISTGSIELINLPAGNWTIQPGSIPGNTSSIVITNLSPATYSFTVTNDEGCTSAHTTPVTITSVTNAPAAPTVVLIQPTCTIANGSVTVISDVTGLTFSLDGGAFVTYPAGGFSGLLTGTHTLVAQNASGCLSAATSFTIITQPVSPAQPVISLVQPGCNTPNGIITVASPTTDLTFSIDGGVFLPYPAGGFVVAPGIHQLAVQNNSGCDPTTVNNIVINDQPASPQVNASYSPITCFGNTTVINATASGGLMPYEYNINGGAFGSANAFTISAGSYTISVIDANGCMGSTITVIVNQPEAIIATAIADPIVCFGNNTSITVSASGGTGNYEYNLNGGNFQSSNIFSVTQGTYNVQVREAGNPSCISASNPVVVVTQPTLLKAIAVGNAITVCGGESIINVTAQGGTAPYTGIGIFNRSPGTWNFVVTDANGCTDSALIVIIPPGCVEINIYPNPAQEKISIDHSVAVQGSALLIYNTTGAMLLKKPVAQGSFFSEIDITSLPAGAYIIVYKNGNDIRQAKFIKTHR